MRSASTSAAGLADHDARAGRVDVDRRPRRAACTIVMSDRPACASLFSMCSRIVDVLEQVVGEVALVEPVRLPVVDVADPEALGMDLLSHGLPPVPRRWSASMVMWLVRLSIRVARPSARGRKRLSVGPSSTMISAIRRSSATRSWLFSALAAAESISLRMSLAAARGACAGSPGLLDVLAADLVHHRRALRGAMRT